MKKLFEKIIQLRNPNFKFDEGLNDYALFQFLWNQAWSMFRGLKLILLGKNPKAALLGRGVRFFNAPKIKFGKFMKLGNHVYVSALSKNGVTFGNNVGIGDFSRIIVSTSLNQVGDYIKIGDNVGIGEFAYLGGAGGLEIGNEGNRSHHRRLLRHWSGAGKMLCGGQIQSDSRCAQHGGIRDTRQRTAPRTRY